MGSIVLKNARVELNGTAFNAKSVSINIDIPELEGTDFASGGWKEIAAGIRSWSADVQLKADFADNALDELVWAIIAGEAAVPLKVRPTSAAISASNPEFQGSVILTSYKIGGAVGEVAMSPLKLAGTGALVRAVSG